MSPPWPIVSNSFLQPEIAQAGQSTAAHFGRVPTVAIEPAAVTGNFFPLAHSRHTI